METAEKISFMRSPFFYVFLNADAQEVLANDLDSNVIGIHKLLLSQAEKMDEFVLNFAKLARSYGLTCSFDGDVVSPEVRKEFPKTYFAHLNRSGFNTLKEKYNSSADRDELELYALMIYGFNRMLRFNREGNFNIPVGNVDFNPNVVKALQGYSSRTIGRNVVFSNLEFEAFLKSVSFKEGDFLYVDPPYLITASEYNKGWNETCESRLYAILDHLNTIGVKFAVSNVEIYGDRANVMLEKWMQKYKVHTVSSNYINYFDNGKKKLKEVLVCNYE